MGDLQNRLLRLLQDPRVAKLLQDPRTQKALMQGLRFRGRVQEGIDQHLKRMARRLKLKERVGWPRAAISASKRIGSMPLNTSAHSSG